MNKDSLNSVALIGLLLVIILVALYARNVNKLVAYRPAPNEIISNVLGVVSPDSSSDDQTCPAGCSPAPTPEPSLTQKQQWQADPVPYLRDSIEQKFAKQLSKGEFTTAYYQAEQLWWRTDDEARYRLLMGSAKTFGVQVQTTTEGAQMAPKNPGEAHVATQHPLLKKIHQEISNQFGKLGYKKSSFDTCPVSEAFDPYNNCVNIYTKDEQKCSLIAGFGTLDRTTTDTPYLRLELSCSDQYQAAYDQVTPYLYSLGMINPPWRVPDMAIYDLITNGNWTRANFGANYGIFQTTAEGEGLKLITGGTQPPSCALVDQEQIPPDIYRQCQ